MDCSVIYYSARKTSLCEKALRRGTASLGLRMASTCFATDAKSLGERLREAFQRGRVCFVAGGLGFARATCSLCCCPTSLTSWNGSSAAG